MHMHSARALIAFAEIFNAGAIRIAAVPRNAIRHCEIEVSINVSLYFDRAD